MDTFNRICIEDKTIKDQAGSSMSVKRGKEYLTSKEESGEVMVFGQYWVNFPAELFAGEKKFT